MLECGDIVDVRRSNKKFTICLKVLVSDVLILSEVLIKQREERERERGDRYREHSIIYIRIVIPGNYVI